MTRIDHIRQRLGTFDMVELAGPQPTGAIHEAERSLGVNFPPHYRAFLAEFGSGGIGSEDFIGLGGPDHLNVVSLTNRLRNRTHPLPLHLLPLRGDGFGNYDCFDLTSPTENGEFAVVQWDHEADTDQPCEVLAATYWDWFESMLTMIEANL